MVWYTGNSLKALVRDIQDEHTVRLLTPDEVPIYRNPFRHRKTPKTAIISEAAKAKMNGDLLK